MPHVIQLAIKLANRSTHRQYKMAAVLLRGGSIISKAHNTTTWNGHCERRALRPGIDARGTVLIVVRSNMRCSKPCDRCMEAIRAAGVKKIGYVDSNLHFVWQKVVD